VVNSRTNRDNLHESHVVLLGFLTDERMGVFQMVIFTGLKIASAVEFCKVAKSGNTVTGLCHAENRLQQKPM